MHISWFYNSNHHKSAQEGIDENGLQVISNNFNNIKYPWGAALTVLK